MSNLDCKEIYVGIDVHLKSLDIQVLTQNRVHINTVSTSLT